MKKCTYCNQEKELSCYSKQSSSPDGLRNYCKECANTKEKLRQAELKNDPEWKEKEKERGREKYHRLYKGERKKKLPSSKRLSTEKYWAKYPEKYKAGIAAQRIYPEVKGNHMHHWSYNQEHWKDVIELSVEDHNKLHRYIIYDQERMMYRTTKGVLLDSRSSHISYMEFVIANEK
jgi:hypothetical protein